MIASTLSFSHFFQGPEHQPFRLEGGQAAALLVHGFPGSPAEMRPLGEALHAAGWTVEGLLLPGFGPQMDTLQERRYLEWLEAVRTSLQALRVSHKPLLLAGFSMGAALSLAAASESQPDGLLLMAPFWKLSGPLWGILPLLRRVFPSIRPFRLLKMDFNDPRVRKGMADFMPGVDLDDPEVQRAVRDFTFPVGSLVEVRNAGRGAWTAAERVGCPALVLQGTRDMLVRPAFTQRLLERMPVRPEYRELDAAHDLPDARAPAWPEVRAASLEFADRLRAEEAA
jgi:carboxylesterase